MKKEREIGQAPYSTSFRPFLAIRIVLLQYSHLSPPESVSSSFFLSPLIHSQLSITHVSSRALGLLTLEMLLFLISLK